MAGLFNIDRIKAIPRRWLLAIISGSLFILIIATTSFYRQRPGDLAFPIHVHEIEFNAQVKVKEFVKPPDVTIVALVFYGRRNRVEMLRCYLERNLVDNGGWLDEVQWVENTHRESDLQYLEEILASSPRFKKIDVTGDGQIGFAGYGSAWKHLDPGKLYVKIDDDVVWFADDAIPRIVTTKIQHPEYFLVSGNMINSPLMGWVHYHVGALHPYLPEFGETSLFDPARKPLEDLGLKYHKSWHYTDYPAWKGPDDWFFGHDQDPPYDGHRWLRLKEDNDIRRTPAVDIEYKTWGTALKSWAIAAQEHYSFLENLQDDRLDIYKFGKNWITDYRRLSINFMTLWADEVLENLPMDTVDEEWLTVNLPKKLRKSVAVDSDALAVHFTFGTQGGVTKTDLLERYHDYALENACARRI